ncbi:DUF4226 domain-containing protein [Mycobacterium sp. 236(2023)]|uniref:DUF4226 domain-containing protein n=1 Tax=Mycobacterium sp. 236(2023) TaxID=3038163 RepID=UPI00241500F2|nr:DUF4226 domain-containing protein [Mycobacterium sp. 236(2023)]MDG4667979.1 DUF4226 domain-containing protein [Mycobacterium sp. 236(2023)]
MTELRRFDEHTRWDPDPGGLRAGGAGWAPPGADEFIDRADPYWGGVLDKARVAYGDPNMHFDTDSVGAPRALVFGDGTPVPADGTLAYRNSGSDTTYVLNTDGTVSALDPNGIVGQAVPPAGYRRGDDGLYAPVDAEGQQIAPLVGATPPAPHGYHDHLGTLTPKNARGDYYVDDPVTGERRYYTAGGDPITANDFNDTDPAPAPSAEPLPTEEQQSGRAADAVRQLHDDMAARYSDLSKAEGALSEVMLQAHATTSDGQQQLQQIQQKIVEAINNPALSMDTPAGEEAFLKFLRGQVAAIGDVVSSGTLTADDQAKAVEALSNLYALDPGAPGTGAPTGDPPPPMPAGTPAAEAATPVTLGPADAMPDPTLADLGLGDLGAGATGATDPMASLASALPGALGGMPPGLGMGMDPLGQLAGATAPLAGLISQLGDTARRTEEPEKLDEAEESEDADSEVEAPTAVSTPEPTPAPPPPPVPEATDAGSGAPPAADTGPPPAPTTVALPDGSTSNAKTADVARAVTSHLSGTPVEQAFRDAGIELPPPGTPVTDPIDPSALSCGAIGMFADRYVVALSSVKALQDGEVVPLSSVASSPDFLGWMDPSRIIAAPAVPSRAG